MGNDHENLGRAELIESLTGEKSVHFDQSIVTSIKALRSDRAEAIYIIAPKIIEKGMVFIKAIYNYHCLEQNICGQTFLFTLMKYLKSKKKRLNSSYIIISRNELLITRDCFSVSE